jgi:ketosteroid isomerase-like protein
MRRLDTNASVARRLWSAVADGDAEAVRGFFSADVVWHSVGRHPLAGDHRGPDGVLDFLASLGENSESLVSTLDEIFASDGGAVIAYHVLATRPGRTLETDYLLRLKIRAGRVWHAVSVPLDQVQSDAFWS